MPISTHFRRAKIVAVLVFILISVFLILALAGCRKKNPPTPPPVVDDDLGRMYFVNNSGAELTDFTLQLKLDQPKYVITKVNQNKTTTQTVAPGTDLSKGDQSITLWQVISGKESSAATLNAVWEAPSTFLNDSNGKSLYDVFDFFVTISLEKDGIANYVTVNNASSFKESIENATDIVYNGVNYTSRRVKLTAGSGAGCGVQCKQNSPVGETVKIDLTYRLESFFVYNLQSGKIPFSSVSADSVYSYEQISGANNNLPENYYNEMKAALDSKTGHGKIHFYFEICKK